MSKKILETADAPAPIGPYSQGVQAGNLIFISGQIALIPGTVELNNKDVATEMNQVDEKSTGYFNGGICKLQQRCKNNDFSE